MEHTNNLWGERKIFIKKFELKKMVNYHTRNYTRHSLFIKLDIHYMFSQLD